MQYSMGMEVQHTRDNLVQEVSRCQNKSRCCSLIFETIALKITQLYVCYSSSFYFFLFLIKRKLQRCSGVMLVKLESTFCFLF